MNVVPRSETKSARVLNGAVVALLVLIILVGAFVRLRGMGARSLWLDEFSTWHVSRMPLAESLRWEPELTIPPLYQFTLRLITDDPRPPEWLLRLPACLFGVLIIPAVWWLGRQVGDRMTACAAAGLAACQVAMITYSQEARPYTMLVVGSTLSVALWYRLVRQCRRRDFVAYVVITALCVHAHYLAVLTVAAQALWWLAVWRRGAIGKTGSFWPPAAIVGAGLLCVPVLLRPVFARSSVSQAIGWLDAPTWAGVADVLGEISFGTFWLVSAALPALLLWLWVSRAAATRSRSTSVSQGAEDPILLMLIWLACAIVGLVVLSRVVQPMFVLRYALPASVPLILFPVMVAARLDRRLPLVMLLVFTGITAPRWVFHGRDIDPGFRELVQFVRTELDPASTAVVLTLDVPAASSWAAMNRLALAYYPIEGREVYELSVPAGGTVPTMDGAEQRCVLRDPRALYLILFRAEPAAVIAAAGRRVESIEVEGRSFGRLLFAPYRLQRIAPIDPPP